MNNNILFLKPVFQERIWGGRKLEKQFSYDIPAGNIGECWGISAHPNGESIVMNGPHQGKKLSELWEKNRDLFGNNQSDKFPLLVKVLDANLDLSVQVHPDDNYAHEFENGEFGKTECWYILECAEGADIIFGHNATSKMEAKKMVEEGEWNKFLRRVPIKAGDFFYVPSGTVHALCEGTLVLEVQQSSDTTYRLYDYNRLDDIGEARELHLEKSLDVITIPHVMKNQKPLVIEHQGVKITQFVKNEFFSVFKYDVNGKYAFQADEIYLLISIIDGAGQVDGVKVNKGDHFIVLPSCEFLNFTGNFQAIVARPPL